MAPEQRRLPKVLLLVDVPNLDMITSKVIGGGKPADAQRPKYDVLLRHIEAMYPNCEVVGNAFTNARSDNYPSVRGWINGMLKPVGWNVFVKPKLHPGDDIDDVIVDCIRDFVSNPVNDVRAVIIVSHDTRKFTVVLEDELSQDTEAIYLVYGEFLSPPPSERVEVLDIRDIPGITELPLPDERFEKIPAEGMWI